MRSVAEQQALISAAAIPPAPVRIAISEALGLGAAEDVAATAPQPGFMQAAIEGYAVRAVDVGGEYPLAAPEDQGTPAAKPVPVNQVSLPVVAEIPAGSSQPLRLQPKQAMRVHTGAPLPALADAVLPLAWSDRGTRRVTPLKAVRTGDFVRRAGDDIQPGDLAVSAGQIIGAPQVGLLAAVGRSKVLVYPRPRVSVASFGAQLLEIDRTPGPGQVYDVNSYLLAASAKEAGADVHRVGKIAGEERRLTEIIEGLLLRSEILVIAGAVGGSDAALLRKVLGQFGELDTTRAAMHPGSVQGFGVLGENRVPTFLLPANPISALVVFEVMVRPLIRAMLGKSQTKRRLVKARALNKINSRLGRQGFVRARLMRDSQTMDYLVEGLGGAAGAPAHLFAGMGDANALICIDADQALVRPGEVVEVMFLANS